MVCSAPSCLARASLAVDQVDGGDRGAGDLGVLHGQVSETSDAEDGHEVRRSGAGHLERLVGGDPGTGERGRVEGVETRRGPVRRKPLRPARTRRRRR